MKLHSKWGRDLVFLDKPPGLSTHAPDPGKPGFVELAEERLERKLWVVHRLDKTTSGAIVFASTAERAEELRRHFEAREVKKKYWFITDRVSSEMELETGSLIEKRGNGFVSSQKGETNSHTRFRRVKRSPFFELWEATPLTGKPHQIRLHAADLGLPILGDEIYGGTPFPTLCLHSMSLQIPGEEEWICPAPRIFERLGALRDRELVEILCSLDRRQRLFNFLKDPTACLRLIHTEIPEFRFDRFGPVSWLNWYRETPPTERDLERWDFVRTLLRTPLVIQKRQDRGQDPNSQSLWTLGDPPERWLATENGMKFQFRREQGLSAGLFLDQRRNREWLRANAKDKTVLNLFSYTSGFSVAAAVGGTKLLTTVDLSKSFIEWSKENFRLNSLSPEAFEWSAADSFVFLRGAIKRQRTWDFVVCDPPSFSRVGKEVFKLKEDLEELLDLCAKCLAPKGTLLFSCNIESLSEEQLLTRIRRQFPKAKVSLGWHDLDYEMPGAERSLKAFRIQI